MPRMTNEQIDLYDKKNVAIHEAGHLTVAISFGQPAGAYIKRAQSADVCYEATWTGQTFGSIARLPATMNIAGYVAERLYFDRDLTVDEILMCLEADIEQLSPSDRRGLPSFGDGLEDTVAEALELLLENGWFFDWAVEKLMCDEAITDHQASEFWNNQNHK